MYVSLQNAFKSPEEIMKLKTVCRFHFLTYNDQRTTCFSIYSVWFLVPCFIQPTETSVYSKKIDCLRTNYKQQLSETCVRSFISTT